MAIITYIVTWSELIKWNHFRTRNELYFAIQGLSLRLVFRASHVYTN